MKGKVRGNKSQKNIVGRGEDEGKSGGLPLRKCLRITEIEAWREWLAPVFQPLRESPVGSDPGLRGGGKGGRAAGPFGLDLEPEEILHFCRYSGTNLCKAAKMSPDHKSWSWLKYSSCDSSVQRWKQAPRWRDSESESCLRLKCLVIRVTNLLFNDWQFFFLTWHFPRPNSPQNHKSKEIITTPRIRRKRHQWRAIRLHLLHERTNLLHERTNPYMIW